jgi:hypothetical protein
MIGSFGGEGGVFFLVVGRVENHLNRNIKMKAKMVKTKGFSKKKVAVCSNNCRELTFSSVFNDVGDPSCSFEDYL